MGAQEKMTHLYGTRLKIGTKRCRMNPNKDGATNLRKKIQNHQSDGK